MTRFVGTKGRTPAHLRLVAKMGVIAILLSVLMPLLSQAIARQRGVSWLEICSTNGLARIAQTGAQPSLDGKQVPPQKSPASLFTHCPYCVPHGGSVGILPALPTSAALFLAAYLVPSQAQASPSARIAWSPSRARAPPSSVV